MISSYPPNLEEIGQVVNILRNFDIIGRVPPIFQGVPGIELNE